MDDVLAKEDLNLVGGEFVTHQLTIVPVESSVLTESRPLSLPPITEEIGEAYYEEIPQEVKTYPEVESQVEVAMSTCIGSDGIQGDIGVTLGVLVAAFIWKLLTRRKRRGHQPRIVSGLQVAKAPSKIEDLPVGSVDVVILTNTGSYNHVHTHRTHDDLPAAARSGGLRSLSEPVC